MQGTVMSKKYLLIYRGPRQSHTPSPADMQKIMASWGAWKEKFSTAIVELGDALQDTGRVLGSAGVTDGPLVESKEVVGGYSIVQGANYDEVLAVAKECPIMFMPGARIEVRELMGY
jgi:hypothetical protein